jgi:hypothetical protein
MYLEVERAEKADAREWQVKIALLTADPAHFGPIVFPTQDDREPDLVELQPGDLTVSGFHPDITVRYRDVPTPEEVEQTLASIPQDLLLGVEDFQFARDERLANGKNGAK